MAEICLISPGHLATNPRLVKEAIALQSAGHRVHVIHGSFSCWGMQHDLAITPQLGSVTAVPFGPIAASTTTYLRQTAIRRAAWMLARAGIVTSPIAAATQSPCTFDLQRAARRMPADLYIAHYTAALPAAALAAKTHGSHYAFDAEDFHLGDLPDNAVHAHEKRAIRTIEGKYLCDAAFITAASPMIAEAYAETYGITVPTTILNVFPLKNAPDRPSPKGIMSPSPSLYWFSQTIGPGRGLETAIEAIALARTRPHLFIRGIAAAGDYDATLRRHARHVGAADQVHILPPCPPEEIERQGALFDLGFAGETGETRSREIALTNKLFSYTLSGVPSVASDIPAHRRIASELGPGITLFRNGDSASLAENIDRLLMDPERLSTTRHATWRLGQERFNWDVEQNKFIDIVHEVLARPKLPQTVF